MIRNLSQFLLRKKTHAVVWLVVGVIVGWLIGVQIHEHRISKEKRDKIKIAERLLGERDHQHPLLVRFTNAYVNLKESDAFSIEGTMHEEGVDINDTRRPMKRDVWVTIEKRRRKWKIMGYTFLRSEILDFKERDHLH